MACTTDADTRTALTDMPDAVLVHILCLAITAKHSAASAALSTCRTLAALPALAGDGADLWRALCAARGWDRADRLYTMPVLSLGDPWKAQFRAWRQLAFSSDREVAIAMKVDNAGGRVSKQRGDMSTWDVRDVSAETVVRVDWNVSHKNSSIIITTYAERHAAAVADAFVESMLPESMKSINSGYDMPFAARYLHMNDEVDHGVW